MAKAHYLRLSLAFRPQDGAEACFPFYTKNKMRAKQSRAGESAKENEHAFPLVLE
jgi:hypothetical protein